jgi:hypothetical protein
MWHEQLRPQLTFPTAKFIATTLKTFGIGESQLAERLGDLTLNANPSVATYAKRDGVAVRIAAKGSDEDDARARLGPTLAAVSAALEGSIWGGNGDEMSAVVLRMLRERGGRLSFVDFASGGALASQLHEAHLAAVDGSDPEAGGEPLVAGMVGWGHDALDVLGVPTGMPWRALAGLLQATPARGGALSYAYPAGGRSSLTKHAEGWRLEAWGADGTSRMTRLERSP